MSDRPRGFSDETNATPLVRINNTTGEAGPKRPCLVVVAGAGLGEIYPIEGEFIIGRDPDLSLRLPDDEGVSRRHARVTAVADGALITDLGSANGTYVDGEKVTESVLKEGAKVRIGQTTILKFANYDKIEEQAQRQLLEAALRDGMTHAFNRRYFMQRLNAEIKFAERHSQPLSLLMVDLDHFKEINDKLGHPAGDTVLTRLVELLNDSLRAEDVLARYGGEEFAVIARGISEDQARQLGDRLRRIVATSEFTHGGEPLAVTISVGIAVFPFEGAEPDTASQQLIERADAALYRAKRAGRNQVSV